jgi:hypothetical protein
MDKMQADCPVVKNPEFKTDMFLFAAARRRSATAKAPEDWRTPRRFAPFASRSEFAGL